MSGFKLCPGSSKVLVSCLALLGEEMGEVCIVFVITV